MAHRVWYEKSDLTFVERRLHDSINIYRPIWLSIKVKDHFLWIPIYTISMELICYVNSHVSWSTSDILMMVTTWNCTKMKSWFSFLKKSNVENFATNQGTTYRWILASAFENINFSTGWPSTVNGILWHHPNGRPETATARVLCANFNPAIFLMKFWSDFTRCIVSMSILFTQWSEFEVTIFNANIYISISVILKIIWNLNDDKFWINQYLKFVIVRIWCDMNMPVAQIIKIIKKCWSLSICWAYESSGCAFKCS